LRCGISGLPIVDADSHLVGVVTEADLIAKEAHGGHVGCREKGAAFRPCTTTRELRTIDPCGQTRAKRG
jgi:CBS-domain-containing membrane protein